MPAQLCQVCQLSQVCNLWRLSRQRPARLPAVFALSCFCCKLVASLHCIGGQMAGPARTLSPAALGILAS